MLVFWIILALCVLLLCLLLFLLCPALRRHPDRKCLAGKQIAHRGLHGLKAETPENTLPAFAEAVEHGFAIETDIHVTKDGVVVAVHDDTLLRLCGVDKRPEDMDWKELSALPVLGTRQTIPTLEQVLQTVNGSVPLLIEFKCMNDPDCEKLCRAAEKLLAGYAGKYLVQSFYPPVMRFYRKHHPEICRGQLATPATAKNGLRQIAAGYLLFNYISRPDFISYQCEQKPCFTLYIVKALGALPVGWTFHSPEALMRRSVFSGKIFEGFDPAQEASAQEEG